MAAWTFRSSGTTSQSNANNQTPGAPAGVVASDLLLVRGVIRNNAFTPSIPVGGANWQLLSPQSNDTYNVLYGRIADGTANDNPPNIVWSGSAQSFAHMCAFSGGGYSPISTIVHASVDESAGGAGGTGNDIQYNALTISLANCLVIACGVHNKTALGNGVTVDNLSGFTQIGQLNPNGSVFSTWWGYQQQTTATNLSSQIQTRNNSGGGSAESLQQSSLFVALKTAAASSAANKAYLMNVQTINNG